MDEARVETPEHGASAERAATDYGPRWAVIGIFLLLLVAGFAYARAFLMPTVLALLLALVFSPPRRALERLGVGSGIAALVITGALLAGTALPERAEVERTVKQLSPTASKL